ncbi:MAG TPA: phasin family protein [Rhodanobacteraceae bacterium]|nr:phasin family protein [Rhodanobacteraceae bacterium]
MSDNETTGSSRRSAEQARAFGRAMMDSAQQIWLAGLGAFTKAQKEGSRFFETLVEEGARTQEKTRAYTQAQFEEAQRRANPWIETARQRTNDAFGKIEQAFDERIARAMQRMQMPTREDIRQLNDRLDELTREVRARKAAPRKRATKNAAE